MSCKQVSGCWAVYRYGCGNEGREVTFGEGEVSKDVFFLVAAGGGGQKRSDCRV